MTVTRRTRKREARPAWVAPEHDEATALMSIVRLYEGRYPDLTWFHAIPNGGWRTKGVAGKLKAEGLRAGVHDYSWPLRTEAFPGLYIELKSLTGRGSAEQMEFARWARRQGYRVEFCRGWVDAWRVVCEYAGIPFDAMLERKPPLPHVQARPRDRHVL